ncbi:MAG: hypothetical protein IT380_10160 [Myxococcales bacterium]|nr:hypothetical protein [Myxococcales bacterium]
MQNPSRKVGNTNAVGLGLRSGRATLLKGESLSAYKANLQAFLDELQPRTQAEVNVVHRVADLRFKLQRADRHEHHLLAEAQAKLLAESSESKHLALVERCLTAIDAMLQVLPAAKTTQVVVAQQLFLPLRQVGEMLSAVDSKRSLPFGVVTDFAQALERMEFITVPGTDVDEDLPGAVQQVEVTGRVVQQELRSQRRTLQKEVRFLATKLSAAVKLNIATTRTLDRYRVSLERSIERELALFEQMRRQAPKSFGSGLQPVPQVELKVVR